MTDTHEKHRIAGQELSELLRGATGALSAVLVSEARLEKHGNYSWLQEPLEEHLLKGARHAMTHCLQQMSLSPSDDENHLELAIARLLMAYTIGLRNE